MSPKRFAMLLSGLSARVIVKLMEKYNWDEQEAFKKFISSELYSVLEREETKVWHYSSALLVQLFDDELNGHLEFPEV